MYRTNFNINYSSYSPAGQRLAAKILEFQENFGNGKLHAISLARATSMSMLDVVAAVEQAAIAIGFGASVQFYDVDTVVVTGEKLFLSISDTDRTHADARESYNRTLYFTGYGDERIHTLRDALNSAIAEQKVPFLSWEFMQGNSRRSQVVSIDRAKHLHREFLPWLGCDPYDYFDQYLSSDSSILVLLGPPGTAKTSFIRSLIWYGALNSMFTYEDSLLKTDGMFVDFMTNESMRLLVVEDADLLLTSREHDGNKIMAKFLNIGDGLASVGKKKIIFTANILDVKKIDNALLRAGRCFDCLNFRPLSHEEARAAAAAAGLQPPTKPQSYTLAELFGEARGENRSYTKRTVGFSI